MKEFIHTVTGCSHIVLDVWTYLILLLRFACKFKSWVLDQMLVSGRIYLIRVFHKTSIGYHLCMDPCANHVIVEDGIVKKLGCGNWYWVLYWSWLMEKLYEILYITNYNLIDFFVKSREALFKSGYNKIKCSLLLNNRWLLYSLYIIA